ncbi:MAG: Dps family protein [Bacteroidota bacterium]
MIIEKLNNLLANYQIHYQNLRALHWNIKGPSFFELHAKFEELYLQSALDVDEIAERILALESTPLHTFQDYLDHSTVEVVKNVTDAEGSVKSVVADYSKLLELEREILEIAAKDDDEGTVTLVSDFIRIHEKTLWMFKAYLR